MNKNTKVTFTLGIGLVGSSREETYTLGELGFDFENDNIDDFLQNEYIQWRNNYLDGGWEIE